MFYACLNLVDKKRCRRLYFVSIKNSFSLYQEAHQDKLTKSVQDCLHLLIV